MERGLRLLALMEDAFSRYDNGLQGQWLISLSKPNENEKHLLMTLAGEHGKILVKNERYLYFSPYNHPYCDYSSLFPVQVSLILLKHLTEHN